MWLAEYTTSQPQGITPLLQNSSPALPSFRQADDRTTIILSCTHWSQVRPIAVGHSDGARQKQAATFPKSQEMVKGVWNYKVQRRLGTSLSSHNTRHPLYNNSKQEEHGKSSSDSLPALFLPHSSTTTSQGSKWIRRRSLLISTSKDEVQQNLVWALIPRY